MRKIINIITGLLMIVLLFSCSASDIIKTIEKAVADETTKGNSPPIIQSLTADPKSINKDTEVKIKIASYDGDNDSLNYKWSCTRGTLLKTSGEEISWKPVKQDGSLDSGVGIIMVEVNDGKSSVAGAVNVLVTKEGTGNVTIDNNLINAVCAKKDQKISKPADTLVKDDLLPPIKYKSQVVSDNLIQIDGSADDWAEIFPIAMDGARDTGTDMNGVNDIKSLFIVRDNNNLYYRLDTYGKPDVAYKDNYRITMGLTGNITKDSVINPDTVAIKDVIEGKIFLKTLGDINGKYISGIFRNNDGTIADRTELVQILETILTKPISTPTSTPSSTPPTPSSTPVSTLSIEMVDIPAGDFTMGSLDTDTDALSSEKPQHTVTLSAYSISKYEITQAQYKQFMDATNHSAPTGDWDPVAKANYPVIYVDWNDAKAFCEWSGGRLPTEAEWEKAARGTDGRKYPWGNDSPTCSLLNYDYTCVGHTTSVGSYPSGASPYGLYDMAGNVWEWCSDWYDGNYYSSSPNSNPQGPNGGSGRVDRGGSWVNNAAYVRCSYRYLNDPSNRYGDLGFRLLRTD